MADRAANMPGTEGGRLLTQNERAAWDGSNDPPGRAPDATGSWHSGPARRVPSGPDATGHVGTDSFADSSGFLPRAAIATGSKPYPTSEAEPAIRTRLRALPVVYVLILAMATSWRCAVLGDDDVLLHYLDGTVIAALGGVIALLSSRWPVSLGRLRALELGMVGLFAGRDAIVQYRLMLLFSLRDDPMMAQLILKNFVLLTAILILTYGLHVPKTWRRAALVAGPLALLPFATLAVLYLLHPETMGWLGRGWGTGEAAPILLFTFDAMILLILAAGSAFGAGAISRLRRQVAEARQLGQYRLRRQIGAGAMGEVYLAEHQLLKRRCALKLIRPDSVGDPKALARFEREVRLTATLSHPNTVEIYDYGRTSDGTYYYVMEYLPGLSLEELVERHGPMAPGRVVYLLRQVCQALREAHARGLIHRDIKPSNVFAARRGGMDDVAKLLDFGLVRPAATGVPAALSAEGQILGTPLFMSPEQATGDRELDQRSDIYSLGAVAYYLLTGRPPFGGAGGLAVLVAHARDPVVPPSLILTGIPEDLERVVLRCLTKDAADRFANAESLERALRECACSGDWDQDRAARWWRDAGRISPPHTTAAAW
jgi:tRNA A-37 threonylcarbamoyl transferase component Bud32